MLSRILYSTLITMPFLVYMVASAPKCNDSDLKWCMEELKVLTSNQDLAFAQNEEELSKTCGHLQGAMECVNNFTGRCFEAAQRELYSTLTSGAQQLLEDLCTQDSDFRKQFLMHASCYQNLSAEYRMCADAYLLQQKSAKTMNMHGRDRLRKSCCLFDGYKQCTRQAVEMKCSKEAADLGEEIVTKAGGPLVQSHCANFKHNSKDCLFMASGSRASMVPPVSYVFNSFMSIILSAASHFYISHR